MTAPATVRPDMTRSHRGPLVVAAVVAWFAAYRFNAAFWRWLLADVARVDLHARVGDALRFFVYDTTKIALLLGGIIFVVTVLRSFVSLERTRALLGGRREGVGNVAAAGLGVVTPFCSCSAVPAFLGFVAAGVPVGITLSFLIASPLVNEVAVVLLYGLFGWKIAAAYIGAGLLVAIVAGWVLGRLGVERWVEPFVFETKLRGRPIVPGERSPGPNASRSVAKKWRRSCARSGRTCSSASRSAPSSTAGSPPRSSTVSRATGTASPPRSRSASRSTRTRRGSCRSSRPCTRRASRWARCSRS